MTIKFIKDIFFSYWEKFDLVISALGFISLAVDGWSSRRKIAFVILGLLLAFIIKLLRQSYNYFTNYSRPLKVIGSVKGEAAFSGLTLIRIESSTYLKANCLLTLYCKGTSVYQPICILEVIQYQQDEEAVAIQIIPPPEELKIDKYLNEESRLSSLYVKPLIINSEITQIKTKL